ncbi:lycopene cyclase domain protein [Beutenbergia cavernae DSM 12333]|uniref:Lycopene cyclase domain protein n=1 Tax=Beutenbergia cavernae (strain ATCC BAA-8 / DSM 12333 / CCUG 43141 / JCM 11478 / NBRC 16432 / NCIMB 13614 / HKI 0122) TaxID=471853 RepID=C5C2A7_BEUC1|nr:lycopene cyclase domain-containing protein [Beutenbergia cavernae]ACQ81732.1 lycopene cyclase domain protein [Beutenbergia cavernae DSM 12333]
MSGAYLALLLFSLGGLGLLDWHRRLVVADRGGPARGLVTIALVVAVLLLWDLAGVAAGFFFRGDGDHLLGWQVAPEIPVEEVVFLTLLVYVTLLTWRLLATRGGEPRPWRREER